ncbi:MAG TPA: gamma-glutamyl-phosphate reductase, partial [Polyangia bacterium]
MTDYKDEIARLAKAARAAGRVVARAGAERRTAALSAIAEEVIARRAEILAANREDLAQAEAGGLAPPMIDRLRLDDKRLDAVAGAVREVAALPDPIGQIVKEWTRPNGLKIAKRRIPLGV